ncbi:22K [Simian adenovirus 16]|uniref:22K n=1 Tax=Simian adenovirus 16 TaxID=1715778 RepID=A0A0M4MTY5_9ADEN|nr:22K [Simian adenovirus 16]ALE30402.1 22K [Simian adenovirus 16]
MPPKSKSQLIAQKRSEKQQRLQETWEEEEASDSWDSQAEEEDEEWEESLSENEAEEVEAPAEEKTSSADGKPSRSGRGPATPSPPPAVPPPLPPKPRRRWDTTGSPVALTGKTFASKPQRQRRSYCSWRAYKSDIAACLLHCGGNISFTRRYLLYHHKVAIPRNILHYYRHLYSPFEALPGENH